MTKTNRAAQHIVRRVTSRAGSTQAQGSRSAASSGLAVCVAILSLTMYAIAASDARANESVIERVGHLPHSGGYHGIAFSRTTPYAYASSSHGVDVIDIREPERPRVVGSVSVPHVYMEDITLGERPNGTKFVLVGAPSAQLTADGSPAALHVIDVTDPTQPRDRSHVPAMGHTWTCISPQCDYAYSAAEIKPTTGESVTPVVDLRDLDNPQVVAPPLSRVIIGHDWNRDRSGVMWHVGQGGIVAYDVTDPTAPVALNASHDLFARAVPWNDESHLHGSLRPNSGQFQPDASPLLGNGNVLLVSEEGNNVDCTDGFQTWWVPTLSASFTPTYDAADGTITNGTIRPLDYWSLAQDAGIAPGGGVCSVHWFDFHQRGFVVLPTYQHGTRVLDIRDPEDIRQVGVADTLVDGIAFASYWVPSRSSAGVASERATNLVYTADSVRGIDIFSVNLPK